MLGSLFRRKPKVGQQSPVPAETPPAKPTLAGRIKAFFLVVWNWTILLAAIAGALLCARLAFGFWSSASTLEGGSEPILLRLMAGAAAAASAFLVWQIVRGVRYLRHRRRDRKPEAPRSNESLWLD